MLECVVVLECVDVCWGGGGVLRGQGREGGSSRDGCVVGGCGSNSEQLE